MHLKDLAHLEYISDLNDGQIRDRNSDHICDRNYDQICDPNCDRIRDQTSRSDPLCDQIEFTLISTLLCACICTGDL